MRVARVHPVTRLPPWTEAQTLEAKKMWTAGRSASQIGAKFGVTRNTVIGRVHRYDIKHGLRQQYVSEQPGYRKPVRKPRKQPSPPKQFFGWLQRSTLEAPNPPPDGSKWTLQDGHTLLRPLPPEPPAPALIDGQPITVLYLSEQRCKWPIGHSKKYGHHFCGQPPQDKSPYCEFHRLKGTIATNGVAR